MVHEMTRFSLMTVIFMSRLVFEATVCFIKAFLAYLHFVIHTPAKQAHIVVAPSHVASMLKGINKYIFSLEIRTKIL